MLKDYNFHINTSTTIICILMTLTLSAAGRSLVTMIVAWLPGNHAQVGLLDVDLHGSTSGARQCLCYSFKVLPTEAMRTMEQT